MPRPALIAARKHDLGKGKKLVKVFYDAYVLNELYFRLAGGDEDYGYARGRFVSWRAEEKIKEAYENLIPRFFFALTDALERSVRSEIRHAKVRQSPTYDFLSFAKYLGTFGYELRDCQSQRSRLSLDLIRAMFSFRSQWISGYGGKKWAAGTQALIDARKVKTTREMFYHIDRILDLQHNSGFILDKTEFHILSDDCPFEEEDDWRNHLDIRASLRGVKDFEPFVSFSVKKLMVPHYNKLP